MEEAKAKEAKQKNTIDRLKKQVDDLTVRNKEMTDELKILTDQVRGKSNAALVDPAMAVKKDQRPNTSTSQ